MPGSHTETRLFATLPTGTVSELAKVLDALAYEHGGHLFTENGTELVSEVSVIYGGPEGKAVAIVLG